MEKLRIDKWLWAARFYKTRSIASDAVQRGHVRVGEHATKPSREVQIGDVITLEQSHVRRTVVVRGVSAQRGSTPDAQHLFEETAQSLAERARIAEQRRLSPEPSLAIDGRPTKRDRRDIEKQWNARWSASID